MSDDMAGGLRDGDFLLEGGTAADDITAVTVVGSKRRLCASDVPKRKCRRRRDKEKCFSLRLTVARQAVGNSCPPAFARAYFSSLLPTIGKTKVRVLSVFSGIFGIETGAYQAARALNIELEVVMLCESNDDLSQFLSHQHPNVINVGSILPDSIPDGSTDTDDFINPRIIEIVKSCGFIDIVVGGWVCKQNSVISNLHRSLAGKGASDPSAPKKSSEVEWNSLVWAFKDVCACVCKYANGGKLPYILGENTEGPAVGFFTAALETLFPKVYATHEQALNFECYSSRKRVLFTTTPFAHKPVLSQKSLCDVLLTAEQSDALGMHLSDKSIEGTMNDEKKGTGVRRWHSSGQVTWVDARNDTPVKPEHIDKRARIPVQYGGKGYDKQVGWDTHLHCILGSYAKGAPNNVVVKKRTDGSLGAYILHLQEALVAVGFDPLYLCTCGECSVVVPAQ
jgi:site-specific DNA-cytosine methylase